MTGIAMLNSSFGAAAPATLAYYLDASAQGAFPGASITTSASFNGSTQRLSTNGGTGTVMGTGDFTWESWVRPTGTPGYQTFIDTRGVQTGYSAVGTDGVYFGLDNGTLYPIYYQSSALITSSIALTLNTWAHVAVVRSSGTTTLYVNGVSGGTYSDSLDLSSPWVNIGGTSTAAINFTGQMSNVRIIKGTALYTGTFTPPTTTLRAVAGTQLLLPLTAAPFMDVSSNLFTITNTGTVATTASAPSITAATTDVTGNYALSYSNTSANISWASTQGGIFRNTFSGDGINAYITGGPDWSTQRSYTVFMGYKLTGTSNYGRLLNSNTGTPDWLMGGYSSKSKAYFANGTTINLSGPVDTTWHLDWARFNKNTSVGELFSVTTSQPTSTPAYTATNSAIGAFNQLKLFSKSDGNECAAGDIAFVRVWNGAMTTAQMQSEWAAFKTRVGF